MNMSIYIGYKNGFSSPLQIKSNQSIVKDNFPINLLNHRISAISITIKCSLRNWCK